MPLALLALAIGAFGIGTTEFVVIGLLPQVAGDFGVSVPTAGLLVTVFALGALGFATTPPLQKRVLDQAAGAPTLASAVNIGAFNLGNALAAWIGGLVILAGHAYTAANWVGVVLAGGALLLAVLSMSLERGGARRPGRLVARSAAAGSGSEDGGSAADPAGAGLSSRG